MMIGPSMSAVSTRKLYFQLDMLINRVAEPYPATMPSYSHRK